MKEVQNIIMLSIHFHFFQFLIHFLPCCYNCSYSDPHLISKLLAKENKHVY